MSDDLPEPINWPPVADLLTDCPAWCTGRPHNHGSANPGDQDHTSGPVELDVVTAEGRSELYTLAELVWYPLSDTPEKRLVYVSMRWEGGGRPLTQPNLVAVADGIADYAEQLRQLAGRLTAGRAGIAPTNVQRARLSPAAPGRRATRRARGPGRGASSAAWPGTRPVPRAGVRPGRHRGRVPRCPAPRSDLARALCTRSTPGPQQVPSSAAFSSCGSGSHGRPGAAGEGYGVRKPAYPSRRYRSELRWVRRLCGPLRPTCSVRSVATTVMTAVVEP